MNAQIKSSAYGLMLQLMYKNTVPLMSVAELNANLKQNINYLLLDTRSKKEFEICHLSNAMWVGFDEFDIMCLKDMHKNMPIVVYCSVGYRSERIGEQLIANGFKKVFNLNGGIFEWINNGLVVVDNNNLPTNRVHAYSKWWGTWISNSKMIKLYD